MATMCTLKLTPKLIEMLDQIRRRCLWMKQTDEGERSNSLAAWSMVGMPKQSGGLGVLDLKTQNESLLLKFLHKFYNRKDIPWVQLTWDTLYDQKIPHASNSEGSFWGRDILKLTPIFRGITKVNVVCGTTTLF